jgi:hypothetical protein
MRSPLLTAFLNPLNLAILALAFAFGMCAAWWLFPLGLLIWAVMFVLVYRDPTLHLQQAIQSRGQLAQRFQQPFDRIERAQISLSNNLSSTRPKVRNSLQPLQEAVNQLVEQSYQQCVRMTALQNYYLVTKSNRNFEGEIFNQKVKIENTSDEVARHEYEESLKSLQEQANNFRALGTLLDRFDAQLTSVNTTLDTVLAGMLRLQALRPDAIGKELPAMLQPLQAQSEQLSMFENETARSKL